jgi:superfamily I DNA/RNA helicase
MRLENWYISNPDENQRSIINLPANYNLVVSGPPGSGKTNIALYRANELHDKDYAICVRTHMMKKVIRHGMIQLGLDPDRVMYSWSFENRGPDVSGDLYCQYKMIGTTTKERYPLDQKLFLVKDKKVLVFESFVKERDSGKKDKLVVWVDHDDLVDYSIYKAFGRRKNSYILTDESMDESSLNNENYMQLDSSYLYREQEKYDYIIIDEGQDFQDNWYRKIIDSKLNKGLAILGDSDQNILSKGRGCDLIGLARELSYPLMYLKHNYRVPKSIAKVAAELIDSTSAKSLILDSLKNEGLSDYPHFDKPLLLKCSSEEEELQFIIDSIRQEELEDVLILVSNEVELKKVHRFFASNGQSTQVRFKGYLDNSSGLFKRIDTIDFRNIDVPAIMTIIDSKGSEYENVFIPFLGGKNIIRGNSAYVAFTRCGGKLILTYSQKEPSFLKEINEEYIELKTYEEVNR